MGWEHYYDNPVPSRLTIKCPRCRSEARYQEAFTFLRREERSEDYPPGRVFEWRGARVVSNFPDLFQFDVSRKSYRHQEIGGCSCLSCGFNGKHTLQWPGDAFFACLVRGQLLWALNREHCVAVRDYLAADDRDEFLRQSPHAVALRHIPGHFLLARNRDDAVTQLNRVLAH